jgi:hypothetical protein
VAKTRNDIQSPAQTSPQRLVWPGGVASSSTVTDRP